MAQMTLKDMLEALRAEVRASLAPTHNIQGDETDYYLLRRTQEELYKAHDWPNLIVEERVTVTSGSRYVTDISLVDPEQINEIWTAYGSDWHPVHYGIEIAAYNSYDPESTETGFPILKYRYDHINGGLEIWPKPSQDTTLLVRGQAQLEPLKDPDDKSTLDGTLIVLFAAADLLAHWSREDAALKLQKAGAHLRSIRRNLSSNKKRVTSLTGSNRPMRLRPGLDYIPEGYGG